MRKKFKFRLKGNVLPSKVFGQGILELQPSLRKIKPEIVSSYDGIEEEA